MTEPEDFSEILVDGSVVINDEDAQRFGSRSCGAAGVLFLGAGQLARNRGVNVCRHETEPTTSEQEAC
jgi:hypothetical protein